MRRLLAFLCAALLLVAPELAMAQGALPTVPVINAYAYTLLTSSGDATGSTLANLAGGSYQLNLGGTFGGSTVTVHQVVNGVDTVLGSYTSAPSTAPTLTIGQGASVYAVVSGGTSPSISASLNGIGSAGAASGGGGGGAVTAGSGAYALGAIMDIGTGSTPGPNTVNGNLQTIHGDLTSQASVPTYCAVPGSISGAVAPCSVASANVNLTGSLAGGTANSTLVLNLPKTGEGSFAFSVANMGSGEVLSILESRDNGATYQPATYSTASATGLSTISAAGNYTLAARATNLEFVVSTAASAAISTTINGQTTLSTKYVAIADPLPGGTNAIGSVTLGAGPNSGANVVGTVNIAPNQTVGLGPGTQQIGSVGLNNTGLGGSAANPLYTAGAAAVNLSAPINVSTAASTSVTTQLVTASGTTSTYVTGFLISLLAQASEQFEYGTGTTCGTGTTVISGVMTFGATGGAAHGDGSSNLFTVPSGQNLCMVTTSQAATSNTIGGYLAYKQY